MSELVLKTKTGICSNCKKSTHKGEIKKTHWHHTNYDEYEKDPLANTIELCALCHKREHLRLNKINNPKPELFLINIDLQQSVVDKLDELSKKDYRSRNSYIQKILTNFCFPEVGGKE